MFALVFKDFKETLACIFFSKLTISWYSMLYLQFYVTGAARWDKGLSWSQAATVLNGCEQNSDILLQNTVFYLASSISLSTNIYLIYLFILLYGHTALPQAWAYVFIKCSEKPTSSFPELWFCSYLEGNEIGSCMWMRKQGCLAVQIYFCRTVVSIFPPWLFRQPSFSLPGLCCQDYTGHFLSHKDDIGISPSSCLFKSTPRLLGLEWWF